MTPAKDPKQQNRAQHRDQKYGNMFNVFFKSTAQKGREYSHWIDLTLNSHFEAVISEIYRTKVRFWSTLTFLRLNKRSKKVQKGPAAPKSIFLVKQKEDGVELTWNMPGLRNYHLLYGPSWYKPKFAGVELVSLELEKSYWERARAPTDPPPKDSLARDLSNESIPDPFEQYIWKKY